MDSLSADQCLSRSDLRQVGLPLASSDPRVPLHNLSVLDQRIDALRRFVSKSLETRACICDEQIDLVSKEIASSIQQIIFNGVALLGTSQRENLQQDIGGWRASITQSASDLIDLGAPTLSPFADMVNDLNMGKSSKSHDLSGRSSYVVDLEQIYNRAGLKIPPPAEEKPVDLKVSFRSDYGNPAVGDGNLVDLKFLEKSRTSRKLNTEIADSLLANSDSMNLNIPEKRRVLAAGDENQVDLKFLQNSADSRDVSENMEDVKLPLCSNSKISKIPACQGISGAVDGNLVDLTFFEESSASRKLRNPEDDKRKGDGDDAGAEIIELDSVELLAEHMHFCEICGKGFKRDANLRMHRRAHGNQFKTLEALSKPDRSDEDRGRKIHFSCPFEGCNRNKSHKRFRPLKSAICVRNHFKRSHCPKMYSCNRCNKKSFSVVSDLKSHLKHCGQSRWRCSCGTSFSRKDKLFGHVALFEGHMPAVVGEEKSMGVDLEEEMQVDRNEHVETADTEVSDPGFFEGLLEGFGDVDVSSLNDLLGFL